MTLEAEDKKEIIELVNEFGELYVDLMFTPISKIAEAKFRNDMLICQQTTAGNLLVAAIPSLANQIDHTLSPDNFARQLAGAVVAFDKERLRLAHEAQAAAQGS